MTTVRIYDYIDFRRFLIDWFEAKAGRPSQRGFAKKAGCGPSLLSMILKGERELGMERAERFCETLKLDADETRYFIDLLQFRQSASRLHRQQAWERIRVSRRFRTASRVTDRTYELFARWYYPAIIELARCKSWRDEPAWLAATLVPTISIEQAAEALEALEALGMLVRDSAGSLVSNADDWVTDHEVEQRAVALGVFERNLWHLSRAATALDEVHWSRRHYSVNTLAVPADRLDALKKTIERFQEEVIQLCVGADPLEDGQEPLDPAAPIDGEVYQIGVQLFPLQEDPERH
jgi:uncharacterized protein (TIGR02147 family)